MKHLDQSHRTLLDNYKTFRHAQQCDQEIKSYLWSVVLNLKGTETPKNSQLKLTWSEKEHESWLQASSFKDWKSTGDFLMSFGIEHLTVEGILSDGCRAFVYLNTLAKPEYKWVEPQFRALQPPTGFHPHPVNQNGYVFLKQLESLPPDSFSDPQKLLAYLQAPIYDLTHWFETTSEKIAAIQKP